MTNKYEEKNNTFFLDILSDPFKKIEIEIGDSKQPEFYPQFKTKHWNNECNFSIRYGDDTSGETILNEEKIIYKKQKEEVHFYPKNIDEYGGFEIEILLKEKPNKNIFTFSIQSKELMFCYQSPLTEEEINKGYSRPDNVEGSYAVYHKTKRNTKEGEMDYATGKAFHIYRPECIDAEGNKVFADIEISEELGELKIVVPQDYLDNAVYPVIVDPTFGYTRLGATVSTAIAQNPNTSTMLGAAGSLWTVNSNSVIKSMFVGIQNSTGGLSSDLYSAIFREDSAASDSHDLVTSSERLNVSLSVGTAWYEFTYANEFLEPDSYILSILGNGEDLSSSFIQHAADNIPSMSFRVYSESTAAGGSYATRKAENPWTEVDSSSSFFPSIYILYGSSNKIIPQNNLRPYIFGPGHAR